MTVLSAQSIRRLRVVDPCEEACRDAAGNSRGLGPCGYDVSLDQDVVGVVHDKSSLARRGIAVQNTVLEPGWRGFVTLEITNHGDERLILPAGSAIAQVIFHRLDEPTETPYVGKYQDQERGPQEARVGPLVTTMTDERVLAALDGRSEGDVLGVGRETELGRIVARVAEIDAMFESATGWGSWMWEASEEREGLVMRAAGFGSRIEHKWERRVGGLCIGKNTVGDKA